MKEEAFRFKNKNYELYGFLHRAKKPDNALNPQTGLVFCCPFAEERQFSQRMLVNFARELAANGYNVLRFDYFGYGDSDGYFEDCQLETYLDDINQAVYVLKEKTAAVKIGLLGLRFGATLAVLAQKKYSPADFLVLWAPILDCRKYIYDYLKINLAHQMMYYRQVKHNRKQLIQQLLQGKNVNVEGHEITGKFYQQIESINLPENRIHPEIATLLVHISKYKDTPIPQTLAEYHQFSSQHTHGSELVKVQEDHFWTESRLFTPYSEALYSATLNWLKRKPAVELADIRDVEEVI